MKSFILDERPKFGESKVTIDGLTYTLKQIRGNGCSLAVDSPDGTERDHIYFSKSDLKALFLLLSTEKQ